MKKTIPALLFLLFLATTTTAQFYKSLLPSPEFSKAMEEIILDFREDYKNIQGEALEKQGEVETYESLVTLPGSTDGRILRFHSLKDTTATWQCTIYSGEEYDEAVRAYQNTFRLVKKSKIKWIDRSLVGFIGQLEQPKEELRFTTSTLQLQLADPRYDMFEAQVELTSTYTGFDVKLSFYKKVKETPDRELH